jgi:hypothetical protein
METTFSSRKALVRSPDLPEARRNNLFVVFSYWMHGCESNTVSSARRLYPLIVLPRRQLYKIDTVLGLDPHNQIRVPSNFHPRTLNHTVPPPFIGGALSSHRGADAGRGTQRGDRRGHAAAKLGSTIIFDHLPV